MKTSKDQIPTFMGLNFLLVSLDSKSLSPHPSPLYIKFPSKDPQVRKSTMPFSVEKVGLNLES